MTSREPLGQRGRLAAAVVVLVALSGLLVGYGALGPDPTENRYPGVETVGPDPDGYVGDPVVLAGQVTDTDPVTIRFGHPDGTGSVVVEGVDAAVLNRDRPVETGDNLAVFGTLVASDTLDAERAIVREPWENLYMYVVSALGGFWVLGRFLDEFRFDRTGYAFVPRDRRLSKRAVRRVLAGRGSAPSDGARGEPAEAGEGGDR